MNHRCKHKVYHKAIPLLLAFLVSLSTTSFNVLPEPLLRPQAGVSNMVPLLGIFTGLRARNRVYRTANAYISEKNAHYDALRAKSLDQLKRKGLSPSQYAAHKKMVALIEQERAAMIEFAESEKFAARQQFLKRLEGAIIYRIIGSGLAQDLFRAMSNGLNSADSVIDIALGKITGGEGVVGELERVKSIAARVNALASAIGGKTGRNLRRASERVIKTIDKPLEEIEAGLEQVQGDLADMRELFNALQEMARDTNVSQAAKDIFLAEVTGEELDDPVVASIVDMLTKAAGRGDGTFRERARTAIFGTFVARCTQKGKAFRDELAKLADDPNYEPASNVAIFAACNHFDLDEVEDEVAGAEDEGEADVCANLTEAECANVGVHRFFLTTEEIECEGAADPSEHLMEITFEEERVTLVNLDFGWSQLFQKVDEEENAYSGTFENENRQWLTFSTDGFVSESYLGDQFCYIYTRTLIE